MSPAPRVTELQVRKDELAQSRLVTAAPPALEAGDVRVKVDRFAFTSNNITYGFAGDQLGYWQFFPPAGDDADGWGLLPVWGFGDVEQSECPQIKAGERLFGYFPPATHVTLKPTGIAADHFVEGSAHRATLPAGYNLYRRTQGEPGYDRAADAERMLFWPLHVTSFCLWDALRDNDWYGAGQVIVLSASSKTAIGLAYGLDMDDAAPRVVGITSPRNGAFVRDLGVYDETLRYDDVDNIDADLPAVLVDMSGNDAALHAIDEHLGDNMKLCLRVGVTHRDAAGHGPRLARSEFFFAPSHIEKRLKDWGPHGFFDRSAAFVKATSERSRDWLQVRELQGLEALQAIFSDIADGRIAADVGLVVVPA